MINLILIQLPLMNTMCEPREKFVPLSLGYLAAELKQKLNIDSILLSHSETKLSDHDLAKVILEKNPDVIGFSCYVWNLERTLYFASQIKRKRPNTKIILGGPEISRDNSLIFNQAIDFLVFGEGEETIVELMDCLEKNTDLRLVRGIAYKFENDFTFTEDRPPINDLNNIASPYLKSSLNDMLDEANYALLETRRGCPYRCAYCFYGKGTTKLQSFSLDRIANDFLAIKRAGIESMYIIDSCINSNTNLNEILLKLAKLNTAPKVEIQVEVRAELLNEEQVDLMKSAGITRVEVGLQSINSDVLRNINRQTDISKFENGVKLLLKNGIRVIIGAIHGLPGDSLDSIKETVDYLADKFPNADNHFYPLCVLPSTKIRREAENWKIKYQDSPPYLVLRNKDITTKELHAAFQYSKKAEIDKPMEIPLMVFYSGSNRNNFRKIDCCSISETPLFSKIVLQDCKLTDELINTIVGNEVNIKLANSIILYATTSSGEYQDFVFLLNKLLVKIYQENPYIVLNLFFDFPNSTKSDIMRLISNIDRKRGFLDYFNLYHGTIRHEKVDSINAAFHVFLIAQEHIFEGYPIKTITQAYFDDALIGSANFWVEEVPQGILVDQDIDDIIPDRGFFEKLKREIEPGKTVRFKNLIAQKVWDEVINKGVTNLPLGEHTLMATKEGLQTAYFDKNEIMLDAAEWILANKG